MFHTAGQWFLINRWLYFWTVGYFLFPSLINCFFNHACAYFVRTSESVSCSTVVFTRIQIQFQSLIPLLFTNYLLALLFLPKNQWISCDNSLLKDLARTSAYSCKILISNTPRTTLPL